MNKINTTLEKSFFDAIVKGDFAVVKGMATAHNNSPAGWAIVAGSADVFELLLDRGADVLDGFSADAQAAINGEFVKYKWVPPENYQRIWDRLQ